MHKSPEDTLMKNIRKAMSTDDMEPTQEMIDFFEKRTKGHIDRVKKFCKKIDELFPGRFEGLVERGEEHDASKYEEPEYTPYLFITWSYKCKDDGTDFDLPEEISNDMNGATNHHVRNNLHHPESHDKNAHDVINRKDRDKPPKYKTDASKMADIDIAEMIADWAAMSEEKGDPGPKGWADKNVNVRWKFTDAQTELIYELIDALT
jgi:hypothetical protein